LPQPIFLNWAAICCIVKSYIREMLEDIGYW